MLGTPTTPNESNRLRKLVAAAALIAAATVTLVGAAGRGEASTTSACNEAQPQGRLVCISVTDIDDVSPSGLTTSGKQEVEVTAYEPYRISVTNEGGTGTLTNGVVTLTFVDEVSGQAETVPSTAAFVPGASAPFCSATSTSPNVVTCTVGNLAAGASTGEFVVTTRTSTTTDVAATVVSVKAAFKEGGNGPNGANPATFEVSERTSLEPNPQLSVAWSPPGQQVQLGTSPADIQFSTLSYRVPGDKAGFLASLGESSGSICPERVTCQTELVETILGAAPPGTFTAQNPFTLTLTISLDALKSPNFKVIYHLKDNGVLEEVLKCTEGNTIGCFTQVNDKQLRLAFVTIKAWENGRWQG